MKSQNTKTKAQNSKWFDYTHHPELVEGQYRIAEIQNPKQVEQVSNFGFRISGGRGITLLLVVVFLSAMLSISLGIFNVIYGQFIISGETTDSFKALYAADHGIERYLYLDRKLSTWGTGPGSYNFENLVALGGCYGVRLTKFDDPPPNGIADRTELVVVGQNQCGAARIVKRGFQVTY